MASFFNRQPEMFDAEKRLGSATASQSSMAGGSASATSDGGRATESAAVSERANASDEADSAPESWVELAPSRNSLCSSVEAVMVDTAVAGDSSAKDFSRLSPVSLQSPKSSKVEFESSLEQVKYRLSKDAFPPGQKSNEWIWDWSSRPEAMPSVAGLLRHRSGGTGSNNGGGGGGGNGGSGNGAGQIGSTLTTPPNSPVPELGSANFDLMMNSTEDLTADRHHGVSGNDALKPIGSSFWRFEVIFGLVVTNLVSLVLGATIGFCVCKRMSKQDPADAQHMITYYTW